MRLRAMQLSEGAGYRTRHCEAVDKGTGRICTQSTREGKPYCPDHVENHPYVQDLLNRMEAVGITGPGIEVQGVEPPELMTKVG
jgi:hypothetical protein